MTEKELRQMFVNVAESYLGYNEYDGSHREIIDVYNAHKPLARGYKVTYTDAWCATFVSAVAIKCGLTDIIPTECGCPNMISAFAKIGRWQEDESVTPEIGDIIMYDWQDSGIGDNKGVADHVGIVCETGSGWLKIIEGNLSNAVKYRWMSNNGRYIRGYCKPDFKSKAISAAPAPAEKPAQAPATKGECGVNLPILQKGSKGSTVRSVQTLLIHKFSISCGSYGADADFGAATEKAVKQFQTSKGIGADGIVGAKTWPALLK